jgi:hypothetical protein
MVSEHKTLFSSSGLIVLSSILALFHLYCLYFYNPCTTHSYSHPSVDRSSQNHESHEEEWEAR